MLLDIGLFYRLAALRADIVDIQGLPELICCRHGTLSARHSKYPHALLGSSCKVKIAQAWSPNASALDLRLIVENHVQQRTVNFDVAVVINQTQIAKFVHEMAYP
jgi:hypothetical protein